jgi:hypothetical protein
MADYFSKYKGRSGPAIDPGIIQMMGSIGDEYAKGISALGKGIGDSLKARAEQKKTEEANKLWTQILSGGKSVEDPEAYGEAALKQTEDHELAIEEARIAEAEVDKVADETSAMVDRLDTRTHLGPEGYIQAGHPLSQVRKITKEHTKFYKKLESKDEALKAHSRDKSAAQNEVASIHSELQREGVENRQTGYVTPREPTDEETGDLKRATNDIRVANAGIKENKGPNYDTLSRYVTKLDRLRSLENEMPGSTIGFNEINRTPDNEWVFEESESGRIVDERVRVYARQKDDGVFKGGKIAEQLLGFNPRYSPEALQGIGVKQEDLERFMTLPQDRLSDRETAAKDRYRGTQKRLEELQEAPMLDPSDFMRKQTREELVSEVMNKVDTGLLKSNVLPNLAAFLDKTKAPEAKLVNMGGRSFVISDPGTTAIQAVADPRTFANNLSVAKFKVGLEEAGRAGTVAARKYFNSQMVEVNDAIAKFEIAQKTNTWTGEDMRSWDAELDAKRLQELYDRKKDITDFYSQTNERIKPTGGVQTIEKY